jgi:hypothetical protein
MTSCELLSLFEGEHQIVVPDLNQPVSRSQTRERDWWLMTGREYDVRVLWKTTNQLLYEVRARRVGSNLMSVVEHETDIYRGIGDKCVEKLGDQISARAALPEGINEGTPKCVGIDIARAATVPDVDPARFGCVCSKGLGQERRLSEAGSGTDDRDRLIPALLDAVEEALTCKFIREWKRGARRPNDRGVWRSTGSSQVGFHLDVTRHDSSNALERPAERATKLERELGIEPKQHRCLVRQISWRGRLAIR